jgi:hypothetical protein
MQVVNLSSTGIGFSTFTSHGLGKDAVVRVRFMLNDLDQFEIETDVVVRVVGDNDLACEFTKGSVFDKAEKFYPMP